MTAIRRPINYFGSKETMCAAIHALVPPDCKTWVDVFCGSAIVTLAKDRHPREVINDLNDDVVNLFEVLRNEDMARDLIRRIELTPFAESIPERIYELEASEHPVTQAWRFVTLSWLTRGGGYHRCGFRWSKKQGTAPEITWSKLPDRLAAVAARLKGVCIRHAHFAELIGVYDAPDTLLFVDPPYPSVGRRYKVRMSDREHEELCNLLLACRSKVILTMTTGTIYSALLGDWYSQPATVVTASNVVKKEMIFTNFEPLPLLAGGAA